MATDKKPTASKPALAMPQMGELGQHMTAMLGGGSDDLDLEDALDNPEASRLAAMNAALEEGNSASDARLKARQELHAVVPETSVDDIQSMLTRDFTAVAAADLPLLPDGFAYRMVQDGDEYKRRIVDLRAPVEDDSIVVREAFQDGLYVSESALHKGVMADMDCRWVNVLTNEPDYRASIDGGFVPVKHDIDSRYQFDREKKRVKNGDLTLYMRPKDVSLQRAIALAQQNSGAIGSSMQQVIDETPRGAEITEANLKYGQSNDEAGRQGMQSRYERNGNNIQNIADQMSERNRTQARGRGAQISVAAPWQKTIIGGKVISDPSQILGAVGSR